MEHAASNPDRESKSSRDQRRDRGEKSDDAGAGPGTVGALHRAVGNQAVRELHERGELQAKLAINRPEDAAEREADRVANTVTRMPDAGSADGSAPEIRQQPSGTGGSSVNRGIERLLRSFQTGGRALPSSVRSFFEPRFERDFDDVRVHTGPRADAAARSINAEAFTLGSDIVFAEGAYRPYTTGGRELLAHELSHVVQQGGTRRRTELLQRQSSDVEERVRQAILDEFMPNWLQDAYKGARSFAHGFFWSTVTTLSLQDIRKLLGKINTSLEAWNQGGKLHRELLKGVAIGVYKNIKGTVEFLRNFWENLDQILVTIYETTHFLIENADPDILRRLGRHAGRQFGTELVSAADLTDVEFVRAFGKNVLAPLFIELVLAVVGAGLGAVGTGAKVTATGIRIAGQLADLLPTRLIRRIRRFFGPLNRSRSASGDLPEGWRTTPDKYDYDIGEELERYAGSGRVSEFISNRKVNMFRRWKKAIASDSGRRPVKVVPEADPPYKNTTGYIAELKSVRGRTPAQMARELGLPVEDLTDEEGNTAVTVYQITEEGLKELQSNPDMLQFKGTTFHPGGKSYKGGDYPKGSGVSQWVIDGFVDAEKLGDVYSGDRFRPGGGPDYGR